MATYTSTRGILLNQNLSQTIQFGVQYVDTEDVIRIKALSLKDFIKNNQSTPYNQEVS